MLRQKEQGDKRKRGLFNVVEGGTSWENDLDSRLIVLIINY
jgi:hypothetical protein